jgi:hypothetical protein
MERLDPHDPERDGSQDRRLTDFEIQELERDCQQSAEELKGFEAGRDLFKDRHGYVYVKPKNGAGPGEFTGLKLKGLQ